MTIKIIIFFTFCCLTNLYSQTAKDDIYGLALKKFILNQQHLDSLYRPIDDVYKTDSFFVEKQDYFYSIDTVNTKIKILNQEELYKKAKQGDYFYVIIVGGLRNIDNHLQLSISTKGYSYHDNSFFIGMDLDSGYTYDVLIDCKTGKLSLGKQH